MNILWADTAQRACRDAMLERALREHKSPLLPLLPDLREQLALLEGEAFSCGAIAGASIGELTVPFVLLCGEHILLMEALPGDASAAARCAKSDRLTAAARTLTLFHGPSAGKKIHGLVLLDKPQKSDAYKCGMSRVLPLSRLAEYVRALRPAGEAPSVKEWAAAPCTGNDALLRTRILSGVDAWTKKLFGGWLKDAAEEMEKLLKMGYRIYHTSDYHAAREYCAVRFEGTDARYGFLTSSKCRNMMAYGAPRGVGKAQRIPTPEDEGWEQRWLDPAAPDFCRTFARAGLENTCGRGALDFAILGWGDDMRWAGRWKSKAEPGEVVEPDPDVPVRGGGYNVGSAGNPRRRDYEALLTRAWGGLVIYMPKALYIDSSKNALLRAGVLSLF